MMKLINLKGCFLLLALCYAMSCNAQTQNKTAVIQTFINIPELDKYFHPELKSRIPLYLLNNKFVNEDVELNKYGYKVIVTNDTSGTNENYIKITQLVLKDDRADIAFYYKIQNISVEGSLTKLNNDKWQVDNYKIFQF